MPRAFDTLPDFFVLGVAKSGTTSLHHYLRQHPELFLPYEKELHFFDADLKDVPIDLDSYLGYFSDAGDRHTGDATPSYFRHVDAAGPRMRNLYGDAPPRFLLLLRDPVERAYSHYLHNVSEGRESLSFEDALDAEVANPAAKQAEWKAYFTDGVYVDTLEQWFALFSREQFHILRSAELAQAPDKALTTIFRGLGVAPDADIDVDARLNQTGERQSRTLGRLLSLVPGPLRSWGHRWLPPSIRLPLEQFVRRRSTGDASDRPTLPPETEHALRTRYAPHVRHLSELTDQDFSGWLPTSETTDPPSPKGFSAPAHDYDE